MAVTRSCLGALALELAPTTRASAAVLDQALAGELASLMARDLAHFDKRAADLDLGMIGALFDPVELLRPQWPLHRELERLCAQAPGADGSRLIAFGSSDGHLPQTLQPAAEYGGGALRLVPWVLRGDPRTVAEVDAQLEHSLIEVGMAGAATALLAQQAFAGRIEHARYLTLHDLAAMMALQYANIGLGALWPLIETALLAPAGEQWLDSPPEPLLRLADGQVRIAMLDDTAWKLAGLAPPAAGHDPARLLLAFEHFQRRQRQMAALLEAHGIDVIFDHCPAGEDPRTILRA